MSDWMIRTEDLSRTFLAGAETVHAVREVSVQVRPQALAVIKGRSGSGKTTLLNLIAGLDEPTSGQVFLEQAEVTRMSAREKIELRRRKIGFVFQTFGLLPILSAQENVEVPMRIVAAPREERERRASEVLALVGLTGRARHRPLELSGGEQQRVAIARAIVMQPAIVLADEPTGQLDTATGREIVGLLRRLTLETGVTVVIASHDPAVMASADVVFELEDGRLARTYTGGAGVTSRGPAELVEPR